MNTTSHQFAEATIAQIPGLRGDAVHLEITQQPNNARVAVGKEKDRKPVDPPPIIRLRITPDQDPHQNYLQSPYFFMSCSLVGTTEGTTPATLGASLAGTLVSSLHRLKDPTNLDGAFFVFGDLSVKIEGKFRLQFNLYEMRVNECTHIKSIMSEVFSVLPTKNFPGMAESTFLTRSFSDQGVRLRLRKEPRTLLRKRGPADDDYLPRHYNKPGVRGSIGDQGARHDMPQYSQGELQGSMHPGAYDPRPQMGRGYSQQSVESFSPSYSDEPSLKRPRTASEQGQSQTFGENPLPSPQYPKMYNTQEGAYPQYVNTQLAQPPNYAYTLTQSPQSSAGSSFPRPPGNTSTYNPSPSAQRSPQSSFYPPQQQTFPSPPQYGMQQMSPMQRMNASMPNLRAADMAQLSPAIGGPGSNMTPTYGRMHTASLYHNLSSSVDERRENYELYAGQGANIPAGMGVGMIPRTSSGSMNTTTGPGGFGSFQ